MEKLILFYDDTKPSCCRCISSFQKHENVECRKMSDNQDKTLIFATGAKIGLVFESENGKVPYTVSHIIWRVVADKNQEHMILVTGGKQSRLPRKIWTRGGIIQGIFISDICLKNIK